MIQSGPRSSRRVLLDENWARQIAYELPGHDVRTVKAEGWSGVLNGELLRRAEGAGFEVFVTADRNLEHQQTLTSRRFGVVVLLTRRLKLEHLLPLMPAAREAITIVRAGEVLRVR